MFEPKVFRKQLCCNEASTYNIVGIFWRPPCDSASGALCPLVTPLPHTYIAPVSILPPWTSTPVGTLDTADLLVEIATTSECSACENNDCTVPKLLKQQKIIIPRSILTSTKSKFLLFAVVTSTIQRFWIQWHQVYSNTDFLNAHLALKIKHQAMFWFAQSSFSKHGFEWDVLTTWTGQEHNYPKNWW